MRSTTDTGIDLALAAYRSYLKLVTTSAAAPLLSRANPVRHAGFERELTVVGIERPATDVVALRLGSSDAADLPEWTPGAHLDVILPSGTMRQYSLCGEPTDRRHYRIAVRLVADGSGGSREVHEALRVGSTVRVRGPRNAFRLVPEPEYLFIAGGIGITPLMSMIERAHSTGARWRLIYLGRDRATMPFASQLVEKYGDRVELRTDAEHGRPELRALLEQAGPSSAVYLCGPTALMSGAKELLTRIQPTARLYSERFSPPPVSGGTAFTVELSRTGATVEVGPNESALTAIRRKIPAVTYSCQQGFCGSCRVGVLRGAVEHRDRLLLDSEREDSMLICVSRAKGPVVLDL